MTTYRASHCDLVIAMGRKGSSVTAMANRIGVNRRQLYKWGKRHGEFAVALAKAQQFAQVYWEEIGRANVGNPAFHYGVWYKFMQHFTEYTGAKIEHKNKDAIVVERVTRSAHSG